MDETLLHAATLSDIYEQKLYGIDATPSFVSEFIDREEKVEIGVFLRPYFYEMIELVKPYF